MTDNNNEELRKAEDELLKSGKNEIILGYLLEYSSQPFGVGYPDGRLGLVNRAFEELIGYTQEELKSINWIENLTPNEFRDMEQEKLEELQNTNQPVKYEKEYTKKDGTRVPVELLVHLVRNENGTPKYYYSFITDITESKQAKENNQELLENEKQLSEELQASNEELQTITEELRVSNEELQNQEYELLQVNEALRKSEKYYQQFFDNPLNGFAFCEIITDDNGEPVNFIYLDVNNAFEIFTGLKREDVLNKKVTDILPVEEVAEIIKIYGKVALTGESANIEYPIPSLDKYYEIVAFSPQKMQFIAFFTDITQRKQAEEKMHELLENEKHVTAELATLIENIVDEVWFCDSQGNIVLANAAARKFEEKVDQEAVKSLDNLIAGVRVYDSEGNPRSNEDSPLLRALNGEILTDLEEIVFFPNTGEKQYRQVSAAPVKNDFNEINGAVGVVRDITKQKKSEQNIRNLANVVESSDDAIITKSLEGIIISWNKGAEKIYGYSAEEVLGQDISILAPESLKDEISNLITDVKQGKGIHDYETLRVKKDGSLINVSLTLSPVLDASRKLVAVSNISRDITERKRAEEKTKELMVRLQESSEELNASNEELQATTEELKTANESLQLQMQFEVEAKRDLEEIARKLKISNKELEQFAYVASHDLQEPLRMVTSFAQLLERRYKGKLDDDADDYIGFIVEGGKRMKILIEDLLEFSRLNTQAREFELAYLEMALDDVLSNLRTSILDSNAIITHDPLPTLMVDLMQIRQLLQNLISNAIKFHGDRTA